MAYSHIEPFGEERADLRAALVAATTANAFRGRKEPYKLNDFLLTFGEEPPDVDPVATEDELRMRFRAAAKKKPREGDVDTRHSTSRTRRKR